MALDPVESKPTTRPYWGDAAGAKVTVAAVQSTPVLLDRDATVERITVSIKEAAAAGARLIALPEAIVPGYPDWVWRVPAFSDREWFEQLHRNAVDIPGPVTAVLGRAAREAGAWVAVGVNERVASGTLYNCSTSTPTAPWPASTASSCPPVVSAASGVRATPRPCLSSTPVSAESVVCSAGRT